MDLPVPQLEELRQEAVEKFWDAFPPFWQEVRMHIRQTAAERFALTVDQFHVLRHIRRGQDSNSKLAATLQISRPAVSQAVDVLADKGLIQRTPDATDRRFVRLELTIDGEVLLENVFNETRRWMMDQWAVFNQSELETLVRAFEYLQRCGCNA